MSITSTTSRNNYTGNGAASVYAYGFLLFQESDLRVIVRSAAGVETTLTLTTHYTVSGIDSPTGGNVTLVNGAFGWLTAGNLTTGYTLSLHRVRAVTQTTDIRNQGTFYPESHEDAFDSCVMIDQTQQDQIDRSIKLAESVDPATFNNTLPASLVGSAGKALVTNPSGNGWVVGPDAGDIAAAGANATAAAASASAASASQISAAASAVSAAAVLAASTSAWAGTAGGTGNAFTLTPSPASTSYSAGQRFDFLAANTNTSTVTVAVSGLAAKAVQDQAGTALSASALIAGRIYSLIYDASGAFRVRELVPKTSPTLQKFTSTGTTTGWLFTVTSAEAFAADTYTNNGNTYTVLNNVGPGSTVLWVSGASAPTASGTLTRASGSGDATIAFASRVALATYTKPAGVSYLRVRAVGGGGGGGAGGNVTGLLAGADGKMTCFGGSMIQCYGGTGGLSAVASGGAAVVGIGATGVGFSGGAGAGYFSNDGSSNVVYGTGGYGGSSAFGGAGGGLANGQGTSAATNSGSGGGGGGYTFAAANQRAQSGGGAGGFVDAYVYTPTATYFYAVGTGGAGATLGTNGFAGGAGAAGIILVEEFYN